MTRLRNLHNNVETRHAHTEFHRGNFFARFDTALRHFLASGTQQLRRIPVRYSTFGMAAAGIPGPLTFQRFGTAFPTTCFCRCCACAPLAHFSEGAAFTTLAASYAFFTGFAEGEHYLPAC